MIKAKRLGEFAESKMPAAKSKGKNSPQQQEKGTRDNEGSAAIRIGRCIYSFRPTFTLAQTHTHIRARFLSFRVLNFSTCKFYKADHAPARSVH